MDYLDMFPIYKFISCFAFFNVFNLFSTYILLADKCSL